tara:strand:- start:63 stop:302 length:240 start_codon:yes stop_codon:yes gene_type:complete
METNKMANGDYFAAHPEIVKIFDDLEKYRDWCRYNGRKFNEKDLYKGKTYQEFLNWDNVKKAKKRVNKKYYNRNKRFKH